MEKKLKKLINKIRANSNRRMLIGLFIIIIGYIFFFNSKFIFNEQEKLKNTPVNTQLELEDRIITLTLISSTGILQIMKFRNRKHRRI